MIVVVVVVSGRGWQGRGRGRVERMRLEGIVVACSMQGRKSEVPDCLANFRGSAIVVSLMNSHSLVLRCSN